MSTVCNSPFLFQLSHAMMAWHLSNSRYHHHPEYMYSILAITLSFFLKKKKTMSSFFLKTFWLLSWWYEVTLILQFPYYIYIHIYILDIMNAEATGKRPLYIYT